MAVTMALAMLLSSAEICPFSALVSMAANRLSMALSSITGLGTARWAEYTVWISCTPGVARAASTVLGLTGGDFSAAPAFPALASPAEAKRPAVIAPATSFRPRPFCTLFFRIDLPPGPSWLADAACSRSLATDLEKACGRVTGAQVERPASRLPHLQGEPAMRLTAKHLIAATAAAGLLAAGCGSSKHSAGNSRPAKTPPPAAAAANPLFAKLPASIQSSKQIKIGSDIEYAPIEFYKEGTQETQGVD